MSNQTTFKLEARKDFERVDLCEVIEPSKLPSYGSWLTPGEYAVYEGKFKYGSQASSANWAWQVEYINGVTLESDPGKPASLGYTLFLAPESITFGKYAGLSVRPTGFPNPYLSQKQSWLSAPMIFPSVYFDRPVSGTRRIKTPVGIIDCINIPTPPLVSISGVGQYDQRNQMLIALKLMAGSQQICEFSLVETNVQL